MDCLREPGLYILEVMSGAVEEKAVAALEALYSGPLQERSLARVREIFAFHRANGQVQNAIGNQCIACADCRGVLSSA